MSETKPTQEPTVDKLRDAVGSIDPRDKRLPMLDLDLVVNGTDPDNTALRQDASPAPKSKAEENLELLRKATGYEEKRLMTGMSQATWQIDDNGDAVIRLSKPSAKVLHGALKPIIPSVTLSELEGFAGNHGYEVRISKGNLNGAQLAERLNNPKVNIRGKMLDGLFNETSMFKGAER